MLEVYSYKDVIIIFKNTIDKTLEKYREVILQDLFRGNFIYIVTRVWFATIFKIV